MVKVLHRAGHPVLLVCFRPHFAVKSPAIQKVLVFLVGVVLGTLILQLIPRKEEKKETHPWHAQTAPEGAYPMTIEDDFGRTVTLADQPRWIVSLAPSTTEMLYAMGMGDHISAVTEWDIYPDGARKLRDNGFSIGRLDAPDIERLYTLPVDAVIGSKLTPAHVYEKIQRTPRPISIVVDPASLDDLLTHDLPLLGKLLGVPGKALHLVGDLRQRRDTVAARLTTVMKGPRRRAVLLLGLEKNLAPGWSPGEGTWVGSLLEEAHGENIAATLGTEWGQFPLESLLSADPEVIFIKDGDSPEAAATLRERVAALSQHKVWQHLAAVKAGRIVILESGPLSIPGPRMVDALEGIADGLWPETMTAAPSE